MLSGRLSPDNRSCLSSCHGASVSTQVTHGDLAANQFGRQRREPIKLTLRPTVFDRDVLAFDIACLLQALAK